MTSNLVKFSHVTFRKFQYEVFPNTNWELRRGENWAVTGPNGSGKTTFLEALEGHLAKMEGHVDYFFINGEDKFSSDPQKFIASVYFNDKSVNYSDFYYQQRYHATETDGIITVRNFLKIDSSENMPELHALGIDQLLDMEIIKLSNGQFKKMMIIKALLKKPRLLLLDNLYTGLDSQAREYVTQTINRIIEMGTQVVMVCNPEQIPESIDHVMFIDHFSICHTGKREKTATHHTTHSSVSIPDLPNAPIKNFEIAVHMDSVSIAYGKKQVLDRINWTVKWGDKWALMGPNGAGKSMLLSLIFADNPQAYANSMILFDRERGTGESIWDIKNYIGYVSPESHLYSHYNTTCWNVALSGLYEDPYHHPQITPAITTLVDSLFAYYSVSHLAKESFQRISTGQQNVVLLIRAIVKNPPMLILDEPFQGFDNEMVTLSKNLLDAFCKNRTLIFVSHNPSELPSCIDQHLYIRNGKVE